MSEFGMRANPRRFVHRTAVIGLLGLMCVVLLSACDEGASTWPAVERSTDHCDESYYLRSVAYHPRSQPPWAPIASIPSWREVDEAEMLAELKSGADVTATDRDGNTLLHWALRCSGRTAVINLLLEHGADVNARTISGASALLTAIHGNGDIAVIEMLLDNGAEIDSGSFVRAGSHRNPAVITLLLDRGANIWARDYVNNTILHTALGGDKLGVIQQLGNL